MESALKDQAATLAQGARPAVDPAATLQQELADVRKALRELSEKEGAPPPAQLALGDEEDEVDLKYEECAAGWRR